MGEKVAPLERGIGETEFSGKNRLSVKQEGEGASGGLRYRDDDGVPDNKSFRI